MGGGFYDATLERKTDREDKGGGGQRVWGENENGRGKSRNAKIKQMTHC